jgi:fatty acid desaturase
MFKFHLPRFHSGTNLHLSRSKVCQRFTVDLETNEAKRSLPQVFKFHLPRFHIGTLAPTPPSPMLQEYRELARDFESSNLFQTRPSFYLLKALFIVALFGLSVAGVVMSSSVWIHLLSGVLLGFFWQQCAFVGHDTGHLSITRERPLDNLIGLFVGNLCTGIGISWWKVRLVERVALS